MVSSKSKGKNTTQKKKIETNSRRRLEMQPLQPINENSLKKTTANNQENSTSKIFCLFDKSKQLNPFPTLFTGLKNVLRTRNANSGNHYNRKPQHDPFGRWGNGMAREFESKVQKPKLRNQISKPYASLSVNLERIDEKILFMAKLNLRLREKVNLQEMEELALLRRYKIKKSYVLISRLNAPTLSAKKTVSPNSLWQTKKPKRI